MTNAPTRKEHTMTTTRNKRRKLTAAQIGKLPAPARKLAEVAAEAGWRVTGGKVREGGRFWLDADPAGIMEMGWQFVDLTCTRDGYTFELPFERNTNNNKPRWKSSRPLLHGRDITGTLCPSSPARWLGMSADDFDAYIVRRGF